MCLILYIFRYIFGSACPVWNLDLIKKVSKDFEQLLYDAERDLLAVAKFLKAGMVLLIHV